MQLIIKMQVTLFYVFSLILLSSNGYVLRDEEEGTPCHCVPYNMCRDNDVDINEGAGFLDIRLGTDQCKNYYEICCENPLPSVPQPPTTRRCGTQNLMDMNVRITDDSQTAQFGEVPWTVAVLMLDSLAGNILLYRCGGSLIHPQVVMTAAHCVAEATNAVWMIRAGDWNTSSVEEPLPHQHRTVQRIFIHPFYHPSTLKNDVALLILAKPVQLADNVGVICLPPAGLQLDHVKCVASGWGKNNMKEGKHSSILKTIELPLVSNADCQRSLRKTRLGLFYHLHRSFLCAGGEFNKDTCKGDGGSPLVCPIPDQPGRYLQMGIVSWGIGCGESETPGVYVNVPEIRNWIDQQLAALDFDTDIYNYE